MQSVPFKPGKEVAGGPGDTRLPEQKIRDPQGKRGKRRVMTLDVLRHIKTLIKKLTGD